MEPSNINNNSEIINQYQYEKVKGEKALKIFKDNGLIGKVAAHRTRIHRSQMDEVKTIDGKKYYIKHDEFTAKIGPSGVNIKKNEQNKETHNNNQREQTKNKTINISMSTLGQDDDMNKLDENVRKNPFAICYDLYLDKVRENPALLVEAIVLQNSRNGSYIEKFFLTMKNKYIGITLAII